MSKTVYFGSPRQARLEANETLPAKLDLILERLDLRERVKDETVAIKMHVGGGIGYSTVHPVFVRKVVQAVKEGGGMPFVADVSWGVSSAEQRGYSMEVHTREGYPFRWLHGPLKDPYLVLQYGEELGLGSREYILEDVLPVEQITSAPMDYIPAN